MFGQGKDAQSLRHIIFEPVGEIWCLVAIAFDQQTQIFGCRRQIKSVPDVTQLGTDALADRQIGGVVDRILCQVELAALPCRPTENRFSRGLQA